MIYNYYYRHSDNWLFMVKGPKYRAVRLCANIIRGEREYPIHELQEGGWSLKEGYVQVPDLILILEGREDAKI